MIKVVNLKMYRYNVLKRRYEIWVRSHHITVFQPCFETCNAKISGVPMSRSRALLSPHNTKQGSRARNPRRLDQNVLSALIVFIFYTSGLAPFLRRGTMIRFSTLLALRPPCLISASLHLSFYVYHFHSSEYTCFGYIFWTSFFRYTNCLYSKFRYSFFLHILKDWQATIFTSFEYLLWACGRSHIVRS